MMKNYIASVRDKSTNQLIIVNGEYLSKREFYETLRKNGYAVRFITTEEKFDEDCQKWHNKNELNKYISRERTKLNNRIKSILN